MSRGCLQTYGPDAFGVVGNGIIHGRVSPLNVNPSAMRTRLPIPSPPGKDSEDPEVTGFPGPAEVCSWAESPVCFINRAVE